MLFSKKYNDIRDIVLAVTKYPEYQWQDAWSNGQLESKTWLVDELSNIQKYFACVYVIGGWVGILPWILLHSTKISPACLRSFDKDPTCEKIADLVNLENVKNNWKFKAVTKDATTMQYDLNGSYSFSTINSDGHQSKARLEKPDCIINTSCDHFDNLKLWIDNTPTDTLLVLQNTNYVHDDSHVNCVNSLDEFKEQAKLSKILYDGTLDLSHYKRFMIIGYK
jgi:hypothetical protein